MKNKQNSKLSKIGMFLIGIGIGAFIPIPKTARISLDIAMDELEQRVIPITIRRVLPNGDFQNIPIDYFD